MSALPRLERPGYLRVDEPAATGSVAADRIRRRIPNILSIAGSDPSGGAGIQADLKSIAANGGYGMAAITALTAQNTRGVRAVHVPPVAFLTEQLDAIADDARVDAVKLGMLGSAEVVAAVGDWLVGTRPAVVVLDPVMIATSGDRLLDADAERALRDLLPLADLVTPNLAELAVLVGEPVADDWAAALAQGRALAAATGVRVLVKGGHLAGPETPDALVEADDTTVGFDGARIATTNTHGTGCSLSSAIATRRAVTGDWSVAVGEARAWLRESIAAGSELEVGGGNGPIHHFAGVWARGGTTTPPTPADLAAEWWEETAGIRSAIDDLPFVRRLADGSLPRDAFLDYLGQDAVYLRDYARVLAAASRLAPDADAQRFWAGSAAGALAEELASHERLLAGAAATAHPEPDATTTAYLDHLLAAVARGEYGVVVAALLPCFQLYVDLGMRLAAGGFGAAARRPEHPYAPWLASYADPGFAESTRIATGILATTAAAATPALRERMRRAYRVSAEHELAFFGAPRGGSAAEAAAPHDADGARNPATVVATATA
ncbi:bifunctional hydroxymethylpyrimidine kinase/phosphomethylpyrimidine kinase [Agromyces seonyuensis]|uniref:Bifunctional hydroxymethylpyrimidine kinase/phosphomethylpyrimidine kinase n=1 Tax=Agromyces seonyuensis TaxID=2662446 RepID=A0A6I4NZA6_9MICO|nr:bifunctional hydroxymethylpyrimidine kinase/phosphomethylpyrimidine kinase [Agromyces seonyuensis]MWB98552.1 bifunctional hydroxymethylpyrimidine kinase/phosphomethylpyrimidine kinase [Agromyces seonyuensis]